MYVHFFPSDNSQQDLLDERTIEARFIGYVPLEFCPRVSYSPFTQRFLHLGSRSCNLLIHWSRHLELEELPSKLLRPLITQRLPEPCDWVK